MLQKGTEPPETTPLETEKYTNIAVGRHQDMTMQIKENINKTDMPSTVTPKYENKMTTSDLNIATKLGIVQEWILIN